MADLGHENESLWLHTKSHTEYLMFELHKKCNIRAGGAPAEDSEVRVLFFFF